MLTVKQVAERANVSIKTVHLWISKGLLRATQYPGSGKELIRRIAEEDFLAFHNQHSRDVVHVSKVSPIRAFSRRVKAAV